MAVAIDHEKCCGCGGCVSVCPAEAISIVDSLAKVDDACVECGACIDVCGLDAITMPS